MIEDIRDYINEWIKFEIPKIIDRELDVKLDDNINKAITIIGPRRAGKTYYLYQLIKRFGKENSLYINFEDTRLYNLSFKEIRDIIRIYIEETGKEPKYLFFDEIQNIKNWELSIRELVDLNKYKIFITGSSSKLLSKEIATSLRGRTLNYILLPFSFREFLFTKNFNIKNLTKDDISRIKNYLKEYLEYGGFPEVVLTEDINKKLEILKSYYDLILFRDIVERYNIKNITLAKFILEYILQSYSGEISINTINKFIKSNNIRFGKNTLYNYMNKIEDSVFFFLLNKYSSKVTIRNSWPKKVYIVDTGLINIKRTSLDIGKRMENIVYLELLRKTNYNPLMEIYYFKDYQQHEVDFVIKEGNIIKQLIQVSYINSKDELDKREIRSLIKASNLLNCNDLLIISWDYEDILKIDNKEIKIIPLWKWLLNF